MLWTSPLCHCRILFQFMWGAYVYNATLISFIHVIIISLSDIARIMGISELVHHDADWNRPPLERGGRRSLVSLTAFTSCNSLFEAQIGPKLNTCVLSTSASAHSHGFSHELLLTFHNPHQPFDGRNSCLFYQYSKPLCRSVLLSRRTRGIAYPS